MAIGAVLAGLGQLAGAFGGSETPMHTSQQGMIPEWQKKRIDKLYGAQWDAANQQLGQQFQGARNQYGGLDTIARMGDLTGSNSVLGQRAAGNFIGSDGYNQILDQSNQRIREQFEQTEMPGILGRFSSSGRIGSPSMMRSAEQAQAGLARGIAQNEAALLQNERQNQMQAAGQIGSILQNRDALARQRMGALMASDPAMIRQQRLQGLNQLAMGNYGSTSTQPGAQRGDLLSRIGGGFMQAGGALGKWGNPFQRSSQTPAPTGYRRTPTQIRALGGYN